MGTHVPAVPHSAHMTPPRPHALTVLPLRHSPSALQQPAQFEGRQRAAAGPHDDSERPSEKPTATKMRSQRLDIARITPDTGTGRKTGYPDLKRRSITAGMKPTGKLAKALEQAASKLPGAEEATACAGTSLEAKKLAKAEPQRYAIGANGWATVKFGADEQAPLPLLTRWIAESHALITG